MKSKIKEIFTKEYIKSLFSTKKARIIAIISLALLLIAFIVIAAVSCGEDEAVGEELEWGSGITENIPSFEGECASVKGGNGYLAAYYENVTVEQVEAYTDKIESECNVSFSSSKYPRSAIYNDGIIVIHYNVTEMKMSVTVTTETRESTESGE